MSYAIERAITNDVLRARWLSYPAGKEHAFLIPEGPLPTGKIRAVCPGSFDSERLSKNGNQRCKTCATAMAEDTRKRSTGLSETRTDVVATGAVHGLPASAERVRAAEISQISGGAAKTNASIIETLRAGDRDGALEMARELDERGPAAPVPSAEHSPLGKRGRDGHVISPMIDGAALVKGSAITPRLEDDDEPGGWAGLAGTNALKSAPLELPDSGVIARERPKRSKASKRAFRARNTANWHKKNRGEVLPSKPARKPLTELGTAGAGSSRLVGGDTEKLMQEIPHA